MGGGLETFFVLAVYSAIKDIPKHTNETIITFLIMNTVLLSSWLIANSWDNLPN
jgi:hypothetical protein